MTESIVVVSGIPRSGTSLMMNMLNRAGFPILVDDHRPADESNPRGYFEYAAVRRTREDSSWIAKAPGRAVKVIHQLLATLPRQYHYHVILMRRPVEQVVASQDRMLARLGADPGQLPPGRIHEILTEQHERTRELLRSEECFDWIEIEYPSLVETPEPHTHRIAKFLPRAVDPGLLSEAVDPKLYRERNTKLPQSGGGADG